MSKSPRRSTSFPWVLAAGAAAMVALVWWDRRQPTDHHALLPGAELATSWSLQLGASAHRFVRSGETWTVETPASRTPRAANAPAVEALLAELELAEVLGDAPAQSAVNLVATIAFDDGAKLSVYGPAVDGTFVERCQKSMCRPLVVRARLAELLHPAGGWLAHTDAGQGY